MRRRHVLPALCAVGMSALLASCGGTSSGAARTSSRTSSGPAVSGKIMVLAAASLTESFTRLGHQFEAAHPGTTVTFSFAGSNTLATQIVQGAPADVFASAAPRNMQDVVEAKAAGEPRTFARNVLEVAVPASDPAHVATLADLARPGVKVAICAPGVPAGAGAQKVFAAAHLTVRPATIEADVKAALSKVALGEVDAGLVWVTDVRAAGRAVKGIAIPADVNVSSGYPIATLTASRNASTARAFVDYVLSPAGATVLADAGFEKP